MKLNSNTTPNSANYQHIVDELANVLQKLNLASTDLNNNNPVPAIAGLMESKDSLSWAIVETQRQAGIYESRTIHQLTENAICGTWKSSVGSRFKSPDLADYWYFEGFARGLLTAVSLIHGKIPSEFADDIEFLILLAGTLVGVES